MRPREISEKYMFSPIISCLSHGVLVKPRVMCQDFHNKPKDIAIKLGLLYSTANRNRNAADCCSAFGCSNAKSFFQKGFRVYSCVMVWLRNARTFLLTVSFCRIQMS